MPLYEYKCRKCDAVFEVLQKFSDATLKVHAGCGGAVDRQMTAPTFQFKGSGWYETDYAKKGRSNGGSHAGKDDSKGPSQTGEGKESAKEKSSKSSSNAKESPAKTSAGSSSEGSTSAGGKSAPPASSDKS
ncbi:MAG: zinc ribbon domain-containing protein [Bryobacteraceae bacterium]|jgi:putative FmdB family regulatory protein